MAATAKYEAPHVQLGRLAVEARREGLPFEDFWQRAIRPGQPAVKVTHPNPPEGCVLWPTDYHDRESWRIAIKESVEGWCRAYERLPALPREQALVFLATEGLLPTSGRQESVGVAA